MDQFLLSQKIIEEATNNIIIGGMNLPPNGIAKNNNERIKKGLKKK